MHSRATDRRSASKCQGKWPDQTLDQAFGLPEVLVAVSTSRLSCKRVEKTRTLMPVWDSSGESRLKCRLSDQDATRESVRPRHVHRPDSLDRLVATSAMLMLTQIGAAQRPAGQSPPSLIVTPASSIGLSVHASEWRQCRRYHAESDQRTHD